MSYEMCRYLKYVYPRNFVFKHIPVFPLSIHVQYKWT